MFPRLDGSDVQVYRYISLATKPSIELLINNRRMQTVRRAEGRGNNDSACGEFTSEL